jgi:hypothetical protein
MHRIKRLYMIFVYVLGFFTEIPCTPSHAHKGLAQYAKKFAQIYPRASKAISIILPLVALVSCTIATTKVYNQHLYLMQEPWQMIFSFTGATAFAYLMMQCYPSNITYNMLYYLDTNMTKMVDEAKTSVDQTSRDNAQEITSEVAKAILTRSNIWKPMRALMDSHIARSIVPAHLLSAWYLFSTYGVITPFGWVHAIIACTHAYRVSSRMVKRGKLF